MRWPPKCRVWLCRKMLFIVNQLVIQLRGLWIKGNWISVGHGTEHRYSIEWVHNDGWKEKKQNSFNDTRTSSCWRQKQPNEWKWDSIKEDSTHVVGCNIDPAGIEKKEVKERQIKLVWRPGCWKRVRRRSYRCWTKRTPPLYGNTTTNRWSWWRKTTTGTELAKGDRFSRRCWRCCPETEPPFLQKIPIYFHFGNFLSNSVSVEYRRWNWIGTCWLDGQIVKIGPLFHWKLKWN